MKTFLKILLLAVVVYLAIKISPLLFVAAFAGLAAAMVFGLVGISLLGVLAGVLLGLVIALAPIWIPVLVIVGLVSLFRSNERTPPPLAA